MSKYAKPVLVKTSYYYSYYYCCCYCYYKAECGVRSRSTLLIIHPVTSQIKELSNIFLCQNSQNRFQSKIIIIIIIMQNAVSDQGLHC